MWKDCTSWKKRTVIEILNLPPPLKYINRHLIKDDRKKISSGRKFDICRKEHKTKVINNEIPNLQNKNRCKTENFTFLRWLTCNKTRTAFVRKITREFACNCLLLVIKASYLQRFLHSFQSSWLKKLPKTIRDCQKLLLASH